MPVWIDAGLSGPPGLSTLGKENCERIGRGYEFARKCTAQIPSGADGALASFSFSECVQVIQSESLAQSQAKLLETRLEKAQAEIEQLTPEPARGRRQYRAEEEIIAALTTVIEKHKGSELFV